MKNKLICAALLMAAAPWAAASCGAAFCLVNTNWTLQGPVNEPGLRMDLRYEYADQDQPMSGGHKVGVGEIHRHHDEVYTVNRNWLANFDYTFNQNWAVSASAPVVDRDHFHIHNHHGHQLEDKWNFRRLGDIRVVGRGQWALESTASLGFAGVTFGAKLPTGRHDVKNGEGEEAERSLQPGSGTTDLILGAFYSRVYAEQGLSWFAQAQVQRPLAEREDYRPGSRFTLDVGGRYEATDRLGLMLQLNAALTGRDNGAEAEPEDTGGRALFLSPGVSYAVAKGVQLYGFVQLPVYQKVNGVQLTAEQSFVAGASFRF
ncbi:transporter [Zoogloea sp.]|uniref:transporter n=1 Tax=Zoogloea sp. TaxID=49181 RepID=UPI0035B29EBA